MPKIENLGVIFKKKLSTMRTLESETDVGQGINIGPGKFGNNNKCRAWNKMCKLVLKNPPKLENIRSPWKKL